MGEVDVPRLVLCDLLSLKVERFRAVKPKVAVRMSLPVFVEGVAMPVADPADTAGVVAGLCNRVGRRVCPELDPMLLAEFCVFVREAVRRDFQPVAADVDLRFETWLDKTKYSLARKEELRRTYYLDRERTIRAPLRPSDCHVKVHMKDEAYPEYKLPRLILARKDRFKARYGRFIKVMEEVVYTHESFVKHVPPAERAEHVKRVLGVIRFLLNIDATAYEHSFLDGLKNAVEVECYSYLLSQIPLEDFNDFVYLYSKTRGVNKLFHRELEILMEERKKSGEMDTSLSNTLTTKYVCEFIAFKTNQNVNCVAEGDDNLANFSHSYPDASWWLRLGIVAKCDRVESLNKASFCGMVFDTESGCNVTNPFVHLAKFGWTSSAYEGCSLKKQKILLLVKSLSLLYQFPGCPVVQELALMGMRMCPGIKVRECFKEVMSARAAGSRGAYLQERELLALESYQAGLSVEKPVQAGSRFVMFEVFGMDVQTQLDVEAALRAHRGGRLSLPCDFPPLWREYWESFALEMTSYRPTSLADCLPAVLAHVTACGAAVTFSTVLPQR